MIETADLVEVSLVDEPSYPDSLAEVRRGGRGSRGGRLGSSFRGRIPEKQTSRMPLLAGKL